MIRQTSKAIIAKPPSIMKGKQTSHQDQSMTLHNFKMMNTIPKIDTIDIELLLAFSIIINLTPLRYISY